VFNPHFSDHERGLRVVKGLHALHVYADGHWLDYLLAIGASNQGFGQYSKLNALISRLSSKLTGREIPNSTQRQLPRLDTRLKCLVGFDGLYQTAKDILQARSVKYLDESTPESRLSDYHPLLIHRQIARLTGQETGATVGGLRSALATYQLTVRSLLARREFPGVSMETLERFKRSHRASAFTCRAAACARATIGFESDRQREEHEQSHVQHLYCKHPGCQYPPFTSSQALGRHTAKCHDIAVAKKTTIRRTVAIERLSSSNAVSFRQQRCWF